ncbi:MAG: DNA-3-methyladenine glycosylase [Fibrobacterota bacterium]|nr:DNA-3-methyladenine glycosylase [Fibrobacterota bacterium]
MTRRVESKSVRPGQSPPLPSAFFARPTVAVARDLLGMVLVHHSPQGLAAGRIVETEAYLRDDAACHASRGLTPRTRIMFGPPGRAYLYLIYGMYHCFNVVTAPNGTGEAVLIRALEPLEGLPLMAMRRSRGKPGVAPKPGSLCSGPGKLVIALGIGMSQNGADLRKGALRILPAEAYPRPEEASAADRNIKVTTRIGITRDAHLPLRFYPEGNPFISRK